MRDILPTIVEMMLDSIESMAGISVSNGCAVTRVINTGVCLAFTSNCPINCRNIVFCDYVSHSGAGSSLRS
jgi:hypothetical protein